MKNIIKIRLLAAFIAIFCSFNAFGMKQEELSPNGKYKLVDECYYNEYTIVHALKIFDLESRDNKPIKEIKNVRNYKFSSDKKYLVIEYYSKYVIKNNYKIFNLEKGFKKPIKVIKARHVYFSPHSNYLIVKYNCDYKIGFDVFDAKNLSNDSKPLITTSDYLDSDKIIRDVQFSNDDQYIIRNTFEKYGEYKLYKVHLYNSNNLNRSYTIKSIVNFKFSKDSKNIKFLQYNSKKKALISSIYDLGKTNKKSNNFFTKILKNLKELCIAKIFEIKKRDNYTKTIQSKIKSLKCNRWQDFVAILYNDNILKIFSNSDKEIIGSEKKCFKNVANYKFEYGHKFKKKSSRLILSITQKTNNKHIKHNLSLPFYSNRQKEFKFKLFKEVDSPKSRNNICICFDN